jgi:hypothetical protein
VNRATTTIAEKKDGTGDGAPSFRWMEAAARCPVGVSLPQVAATRVKMMGYDATRIQIFNAQYSFLGLFDNR